MLVDEGGELLEVGYR